MTLLSKIDKLLLPTPREDKILPYVWLLYLGMYILPMLAMPINIELAISSVVGISLFLVFYFNGYWHDGNRIWLNIIAIAVLGSWLSLYLPVASVFFVYAGAFCSRLISMRLTLVAIGILMLWIVGLSYVADLSVYFFLPALIFTPMIGLLNTYHFAMARKRDQLNLSQQEVQHFAKIAERERIARDMHDSVGHSFSVIALKAELAEKLISINPEQAKTEIKELQQLARTALAEVREVISGYRSGNLKDELKHAKYVLQSNEVVTHINAIEFQLPEQVSSELAMVLRELVTNILKHANATEVKIQLEQLKDKFTLQVSDNGNSRQLKQQSGNGLKGIEERITDLNGQLSIAWQNGMQVSLSVPLV
ncbi:sensor histidine kinase [Alteromonadaceae bacterium BrNp21-10]|nr:sensor histidine kinase [Alteromonadaceae bacterium BrNp21-10]